MKKLHFFSFIIMLLSAVTNLSAQKQTIRLTLDELVKTAADQSPAAVAAKYNFLASYWQFCTYKAQLLPSASLNASAGKYNRSLVSLQNYETGAINYVQNDNLQNSLSLSMSQNIALTGGTVSVITSLSRLDQFSPDKEVTFYSNPVNIYYNQPINAFNSLKWDKKIEPKKFESAKRVYIEAMENISVQAVTLFFSALSAQSSLDLAMKNLQFSETAVKIAGERYKIGSIDKKDLLQLQLRLNNDKLSVNDARINLETAMLSLRSYLGYNENADFLLLAPDNLPEVNLSYEDVYTRALENTSEELNNELSLLNAGQSVAQAKASRGLQATLYAQFGLTQKGETTAGAYRNPMDQEIMGLSISMPIVDWGLGKGKVKLAKSKEEVIKTQVDQARMEFRQNILISVLQFNNQLSQCSVSKQADSIATVNFGITSERFRNGTIGILELNTSRSEKDEAAKRYLSDLSNYWKYYYKIRVITLFDYLSKSKIDADFDKLITGN